MTQIEGGTDDFLDTLNPIRTLFARIVKPLTKVTPIINQEWGRAPLCGEGQRYRQVYVHLMDVKPHDILLGEIKETLDL